MGATNCPETPRQKMISMMYLVYTALLALNVSVQILDGYKLVDESLQGSIKIAEGTNATLAAQFENLAAQNPAKTEKFLKQSKELNEKATALYNYVDKIKKTIILKTDGADADTANMTLINAGDLNIASEVGLSGSGRMGMGTELKKMVNDFCDYACSMVDAKDTARINSLKTTFATPTHTDKEGIKHEWESTMFEDMPGIASLTMLTKVQNDVRNTQASLTQYLIGQVDAGDFRVNKIEALAIPKSAYVLKGGKYEAKIILAATDSTKPLDIVINGKQLDKNAIYSVGCGSVGTQKFTGTVKMKKPDGTEVSYPLKSEYTVGEPTATVSADLMNVFYAGFDNPISVSVPGVSAGDVKISCTNANLRQSSKGWIVKPLKVGTNCDITVNAMIDGKLQKMALKSFRVKALPPPLAFLHLSKGDFPGGKIRKASLLEADKVVAKLDDADLDVKYEVFGFDMKTIDSMGNIIVVSSSSPNITDAMKQKMKGLSSGKTFYISGVKAMGPDKVKRVLPVMEVVIQ